MPKRALQYAVIQDGMHRVSLGWAPRQMRSSNYHLGDGDNDWLKIYGHVDTPRGAWTFADQAFTAKEVLKLAAWLRARPWQSETSVFIEEPCLRFVSGGEADGNFLLRIRFAGECSPPWIMGEPEHVWGDGYMIKLRVTDAQLMALARQFEAMLGR